MGVKRTFRFECQPLQLNQFLKVVQDGEGGEGAVAGQQMYDVLGGGYYPDYTMFPLVLQPIIEAYDPDGVLGSGLVDITKDMGAITWYEILDGGEPQMITSGDDYEVTMTGAQAGRLKVKKNVSPERPLTLRYTAKYADPRTGANVYPVEMEVPIRCTITTMQCELRLDQTGQHFFNPFKNPVQTINAAIYSGGNRVAAERCKCVWLIRNGEFWEAPGSKPELMFATVSDDTMSLTVNMEFMGETSVIKCFGIVSDDPAALAAKDESHAFASKSVRLTRRIPRFEADILSMPAFIPRTQKEVYPQARFNFVSTDVANPEQEMAIDWKTMQGANSGSMVNLVSVASGVNPAIPADKVSASYGQILEMNIADRGPWQMLADGQGNLITDGAGNIIMAR